MMIDHVCVDVEIAKTIEEVGGWDNTERMGVAVACLWEFRTERMRIYGPDDVSALRSRLLKADRISGFNIWRFDFPVIWGQAREWWDRPALAQKELQAKLRPKTDDMLRRIWQALGLNPDVFSDAHKGWGLDAVASDTLHARKIGYGGDAPKWFQAGQIQRVANYCADDVALERDLTIFVERYGYVLNRGETLDIPTWQGA
jgi:DEAD/DEAH box helicase domain-containing protein